MTHKIRHSMYAVFLIERLVAYSLDKNDALIVVKL